MSVDTVITDAGFDLLRAAPGHKLIYTRAVCGSGHVEKMRLTTLTAITDYVMDLSIVEFGATESAATLRLQLDNSKAPREFQLYQIGVCAKLMDGDTELIGETLLQVMQYDQPDIVRAVPHVSEFVVNTLIGQAANVEGIIDLAAYVSLRQLNNSLKEINTTLSTKVNMTSEICPDLDTFIEVNEYMAVTSDTQNRPALAVVDFGRVINIGTDSTTFLQILYVRGSAILYRGYAAWEAPKFHRWRMVADNTPPQEHPLPLAAGVSATLAMPTYFKAQDGVVVVTLDINANEQIAKGITKVVANLPEGYRPTRKINVCVLTHYAGVDGVALVTIFPNGAVSCASAANSWQHFYGQLSFVASYGP